MNLLKKLYEIHSPSGSERAMKKFIKGYVKRHIPGVTFRSDHVGNLYITRGNSETYPCIVAHLDQVQREHSKDFKAIETEDIIFGYSPRNRRKEGLGADDKNGIWVALKCLEKYECIKVVFFVSEEIGCIGSRNADMNFFEDTRFVIEPDRRGYEDLITDISFTSLCSNEFLRDIGFERFGYKEEPGMMTDVLELKERALGVSCINLSCGYYEPHSDEEFTVKKDLLNCLRLVEHIIENCQSVYPHETLDSGYYNGYYGMDAETEIWDILSCDPNLSVEDLYEMYHTNYPFLKKEDFERIYNDFNELMDEEDLWKDMNSNKAVNTKRPWF